MVAQMNRQPPTGRYRLERTYRNRRGHVVTAGSTINGATPSEAMQVFRTNVAVAKLRPQMIRVVLRDAIGAIVADAAFPMNVQVAA